jgi:hypothetical protein
VVIKICEVFNMFNERDLNEILYSREVVKQILS